ncbi:FAD-binding oxidoreductase [Nocardiopsis sp. EMB25]|uniref:FAD-binding oxidoreductase n=1 Tax=Nocardiopsis sp. EMB25 TaxID=2835867 RepID=UPI00228528CE|nr:FAD-binding oxidoreductase [Nocardiopsis sp. EMB25]MCY9786000.1 FAD-binding oxidoreductase [Nocardiopsis sp. EMB25]
MAQLKAAMSDTALEALRSRLTGPVLTPGGPEYEDARTVFNGMIDLHPSAIAECASVDDVRRCVECAREEDLELSVRGGGHSVAGMGLTDGGLVIDLRRMHSVTVDPEAMEARVGGGALMRDLDATTAPFGLATTGGRVSTTGVAGFALGGGSGWLERKFGLACDNLLNVDLVTAEGDRVHASAGENPELFWALHGGGGNFGVATQLAFRLHPLPRFSLGLLLFHPDTGPGVVRVYRNLMDEAPDELGGGVIYLVPQPEPFIPDELVGTLMCAVVLTCVGDERMLRDLAAPLSRMGAEAELLTDMPYAEAQKALDDPPGYRNYWSVEHLNSLPDEFIERFCARAHQMLVPSPTQHVLFPFGGAMDRSKADYPVPWRHAAWAVHPLAMWEDPADDHHARDWVHDVREDTEPWRTGDVYLNFVGDEGSERVVAGRGLDNHQRLAEVKREFDPDNVFHRNHNIWPAHTGYQPPKPRSG